MKRFIKLITFFVTITSSISAQRMAYNQRTLDRWYFSKDNKNWEMVTIPHSCNAIDGHSPQYYRGLTYYKTTIHLEKNQISKPHFLLFEGAAQAADVYVNGYLTTKHMGGYTAFTVPIQSHLHNGDNEITVVCDNHENVNLIPVASDFNKNNGLHNPAHLLEMNEVYFSPSNYGPYRMHVSTPSVSGDAAKTAIVTKIQNASEQKKRIKISIVLTSQKGAICYKNEIEKTIDGNTGTTFQYEFNLDRPHLWNGLEDPYLYDLSLTIKDTKNNILDIASTKVGYRFYKMTPNDGFFLNDRPYPLRGVAMHQDTENKASALSTNDFYQDFEDIKELGANFLRLAHYPHRDIAFRLCDSLGIVVQTEIPWVNVCGEYATEEYFSTIRNQMKEMIHNLYNHPSIIFWGMWNEVQNWGNKPWLQGKLDVQKLQDNTAALHKLSKTLDPYRYVGLTECSIFKYKGYDKLEADYYSENRYNGWYVNTFNFDVFSKDMNYIHDKMGICNVAEYGGGINPFCHTTDSIMMANRKDDTRHYEEYGNLIHESHIRQIMDMPFLNFTSLWILYDFPVANRQEGFMDSDDGIVFTQNDYRKYTNDKGLVTRNRKTKKDVFYLYKSWWNKKETTVYITSRRLKYYPKDKPVDIKVYSNATSLTLYQNDKIVSTLSTSGERSGVIWTFKNIKKERLQDTFRVVAPDGTANEITWTYK